MPTQFVSATGQSRIAATVSSEFPKTNAVVPADRVDQLYASGAGSRKLTVEGAAPDALNLRLTAPRNGLVVAAMRTKPRDVDYAEDRIGTILEEYNIGPLRYRVGHGRAQTKAAASFDAAAPFQQSN